MDLPGHTAKYSRATPASRPTDTPAAASHTLRPQSSCSRACAVWPAVGMPYVCPTTRRRWAVDCRVPGRQAHGAQCAADEPCMHFQPTLLNGAMVQRHVVWSLLWRLSERPPPSGSLPPASLSGSDPAGTSSMIHGSNACAKGTLPASWATVQALRQDCSSAIGSRLCL